MRTVFKTLIIVGLLVFMFGVDFVGETPSRIVFVREAEAIIGLPFTPLSFAGVARRTAFRRTAWAATAATAAVATSAAVAGAAAAGAAAAAPPPPSTVVVVNPPASAAPTVVGVPIGTVVHVLPGGCTSVVVGGVDYSDCGGSFYKAAFEGNNLVYVVVQNPLR
jgi:hypothetical protein